MPINEVTHSQKLRSGDFYDIRMHFLHYIMLGVIIFPPQQTGDFYPTSVESWPTVCDAGPAFTQPWANVSCLQGHPSLYRIGTDSEYINDYGTLSVRKPEI